MTISRDTRRLIAICAVLAAITLAVYWQVAGFDFTNYDDNKYVQNNPFVLHGLDSVTAVYAFRTVDFGLWQPLVWISYQIDTDVAKVAGWVLDMQIGPHNAGVYHLTNVIFHIANTLLLFLVLSRMTGRVWRCAFVAALFAVHPLHVESVAWIAERKDVLSTFFLILAIWAYARYVERPALKRYLLLPEIPPDESVLMTRKSSFCSSNDANDSVTPTATNPESAACVTAFA